MRRTTRRFNLAPRIVAGSERSGRDPCNGHTQTTPTPCNVCWAQTAGWPYTFGPVAFLADFHLQPPSLHDALIHHPARAKLCLPAQFGVIAVTLGIRTQNFERAKLSSIPRTGLALGANCLMPPVVVDGKGIFAPHVFAENMQWLG